ncbi:Serine-threonine protein kinase, putative [Theobroma cacao]|uniref:Serine-threonine protein kinase, putative n=1 Tax=Theobroma cacao TaxID=3641 RepID=A0A061F9K5_THECC|nr:Serine-threonine protein kinase, putative [Theobroma cacao]
MNNLGGIIPECFGNLTSSLLQMNLFMNNFHGKLSRTLFPKSCSLISFRINNNQLEGPIPQSLVNCKDLALLDLGNNNLSGTFPTWLGKLNLQVLGLRFNRFHGHIVNSEVASSFSHLRIIDLSHNEFSGCLPPKLLESLNAISNGYEKKGEVEFMRTGSTYGFSVYYDESFYITIKGLEMGYTRILISLMAVDFSNNQFTGHIPEIIGKLQSLIVLNLSHNSFTGPIPSSLSNLSKVESLDLSSNKLDGRIPAQLNNLGFLAGLEPPPTIFDDDDDDTTKELNWRFSILMGYGSGLVFGLSMGYIVFTTGKPSWFLKMTKRVQQKYVTRT